MSSSRSSFDAAILSAWRGQLAATGKRLGIRTYLLQYRQELLPRFSAIYRQLRALPRRLRKSLQRRWRLSLAGVALTLTLQPLSSEAANFTAGTATELVTAINTANSTAEADTITLTADITLSATNNTTYGPTGLPVVSSTLTIAGNHHTIRREPSNPDQFRLLAISSSGNLTLQDTTLSGGDAAGEETPDNRGGGLFNRLGQLTLERCTVSGNTAGGDGGGMYSNVHSYGTITLTNSTVSGNTAGGAGGGIFSGTSFFFATVALINSTVSGNTAGGSGGGMFNYSNMNSTMRLTSSTVRNNAAGGDGGGIFSRTAPDATVVFTNDTVSGNTADGSGGGVSSDSAYSATAQLVDTTVSGNTAGHDGGGVILSGDLSSAITLAKSTVSGNSAGHDGGGVVSVTIGPFGANVQIVNSTVSGNSAGHDGGGVVLNADTFDSEVGLTNSTVSGNTASETGGGVVSSGTSGNRLFGPGIVALNRSLLSGNSAPTGAEVFHRGGPFGAALNLFGHNGLTTAQALSGVPTGGTNILATSDGNKPTALADILDTTLRDNGGPTLTQNLAASSPAIDAAPADANCPATDQRGAPRPVDGNGDGVAACDIGAVEFGSFPSSLDCSTATASVDFPRLGNRHRYPVTIGGVTASPGDEVDITINTIFQDEPVTSPTGTTCPDGIGVGTAVAKVRNERIITTAGDGRVYHIGFTATGGTGASCTGEVQVCVPQKEGEACGDQGALFDSTVCP